MGKLFKIGFVVLFLMIISLLALNYYYGYTNYLGLKSYIGGINDPTYTSGQDRCDNMGFRKEEFRDECYLEVAVQFLNTDFCDKISTGSKEECTTLVNRAEDLDACLSFYAKLDKNLPAGERNKTSIECYANQAFYTNNPDFCEQVLDHDPNVPINKYSCYWKLAQKMDFNLEICDKTGNKDRCYFESILIKDDPSLCTKLSYTTLPEIESYQIRLRDICFYYFAQKEKKSEICDGINISDLRRHCKLNIFKLNVLTNII